MNKYFYPFIGTFLSIFSPLKASPLAGMESEKEAPVLTSHKAGTVWDQLLIVANASSRGRVILQSWERYQSNHPSFKLDPELDILVLEHLMELLRPACPLRGSAVNCAILKDKDKTDSLSSLFFGKILYISNGDEYRKILNEWKKSNELNLAGLSPDEKLKKKAEG
jgi:hypothetical protein